VNEALVKMGREPIDWTIPEGDSIPFVPRILEESEDEDGDEDDEGNEEEEEEEEDEEEDEEEERDEEQEEEEEEESNSNELPVNWVLDGSVYVGSIPGGPSKPLTNSSKIAS